MTLWMILAVEAGWLACRVKDHFARGWKSGAPIRSMIVPKRGDRREPPSVTERV